MLIIRGTAQRRPWYVSLETDTELYEVYHQSKPFVASEAGVNMQAEALIKQYKEAAKYNPNLEPLRMVHIIPLAWNECRPA